MNAIFSVILGKLKEPSTWHGLNILCAAIGFNVAPELVTGIANTGIAVAGLIEVVRKEQ